MEHSFLLGRSLKLIECVKIASRHRWPKCFFSSLKPFKVVIQVFVSAYNEFGKFNFEFSRFSPTASLTRFLPHL